MDRLLSAMSAMNVLFLKLIAWRPTQKWLWQFSTVTGAVGIVLTLLLFWQQSTGAHVVPEQQLAGDLNEPASDPNVDDPTNPATASHPDRRRHASVVVSSDQEAAETPETSANAAEDPFDSPNRAGQVTEVEQESGPHHDLAQNEESAPHLTFAETTKEPADDSADEKFLEPEEKPESAAAKLEVPEERTESHPADQLTLSAPLLDEPQTDSAKDQDEHPKEEAQETGPVLDAHEHAAAPASAPILTDPEPATPAKPEPLQIADASQSASPKRPPRIGDDDDDPPAGGNKPTPVLRAPAATRTPPALPAAQSTTKSPLGDDDNENFQKPARSVPPDASHDTPDAEPPVDNPSPKPAAVRQNRNPFEDPDESPAGTPKKVDPAPAVRRNPPLSIGGDDTQSPSPMTRRPAAVDTQEVKPIPMPTQAPVPKAAQARPTGRITGGGDDDAFLSKPPSQNRAIQVDEESRPNSAPPKSPPLNSNPPNDGRSNPMPPEPRATPEVYARPRGPRLSMEITAPNQVPLGEVVTMQFKFQNTGTETATGVVAFDELPDGLRHARSHDLEYRIGRLAPGEVRFARLSVTAERQGVIINHAVVKADGGLFAEASKRVEVFEQRISVKCSGPERIAFGCPITFSTVVVNSGNEAMRDVLVEANLPAGARYQGASEGGQFDPGARIVSWRVADLPPGEKRAFLVRVASQELGTQSAVVHVRDAEGDAGQARWETRVECPQSASQSPITYGSPIGQGSPISYVVPIGSGY